METLVGLLFAAAPFGLMAALLLLVERRTKRREREIARQIALTDALHAQLGAIVAPVVRRRRREWEVSVAVPADQPAVAASVLRTVDDVFGRVPYELRVRRQLPPATVASEPRAARATRESLSWT
jgi:hypothetical protein